MLGCSVVGLWWTFHVLTPGEVPSDERSDQAEVEDSGRQGHQVDDPDEEPYHPADHKPQRDERVPATTRMALPIGFDINLANAMISISSGNWV